jgi:alkyl hydroperoxide reductase subunit AhpF
MMTDLLSKIIRQQVKEALAPMEHPVHILFLSSQLDCETCSDTRKLLEEVVTLSDKLSISVYDLETDKDIAEQYIMDKTPGLAILAVDDGRFLDYGIRLSGIPSGHEFTTLIQDILLVSRRDSGLSSAARSFLAGLKKPVHLQVFVTPT